MIPSSNSPAITIHSARTLLEFGKYWYRRFMKSDAIVGPTESHEFLKQFVEHEYNVSRADSSGNEKSV